MSQLAVKSHSTAENFQFDQVEPVEILGSVVILQKVGILDVLESIGIGQYGQFVVSEAEASGLSGPWKESLRALGRSTIPPKVGPVDHVLDVVEGGVLLDLDLDLRLICGSLLCLVAEVLCGLFPRFS